MSASDDGCFCDEAAEGTSDRGRPVQAQDSHAAKRLWFAMPGCVPCAPLLLLRAMFATNNV